MTTVLYSASPLGTFMSTYIGLGFMIVLGMVAVIFAVFNRKEKKITRVFMAFLGLFLCTLGALGVGFTALNMLNGTKKRPAFY